MAERLGMETRTTETRGKRVIEVRLLTGRLVAKGTCLRMAETMERKKNAATILAMVYSGDVDEDAEQVEDFMLEVEAGVPGSGSCPRKTRTTAVRRLLRSAWRIGHHDERMDNQLTGRLRFRDVLSRGS
jgi:hypothetical protein